MGETINQLYRLSVKAIQIGSIILIPWDLLVGFGFLLSRSLATQRNELGLYRTVVVSVLILSFFVGIFCLLKSFQMNVDGTKNATNTGMLITAFVLLLIPAVFAYIYFY